MDGQTLGIIAAATSGINTAVLIGVAIRAGRWIGAVDTKLDTLEAEVGRLRDQLTNGRA